MNYFAVAILTVGASLLTTKLLPNTIVKKVLGVMNERLILWITAIIFVITCAMGVFKYNAMQMGLWDFGIYDSMMHNMVNGGKFMHDFRGGAYDHFSPIMFLLYPIYAISDSPYNLIITQALAMAVAGPILFLLARKYFPTGPVPFLLTLAYFLNPYYCRLVYYDFHSETLYPLFLFSAFLLRANHKKYWFMFLLLATPMIKEDFVIPLGAIGLYFLCCKNQRKLGAILMIAAVLWTLFVLKIYFPAVNDGGYWHYNRYELSIENIGVMIGKTFSVSALAVLISIILPFAFIPLRNWKFFVLVVMPTLGVQLVSSAPDQNFLKSHYASAIIAVVPIAALWGIRSLRRTKTYNYKLASFALSIIFLGHFVFCEIADARFYTFINSYIYKNHCTIIGLPLTTYALESLQECQTHADEFYVLSSLIPPNTTVMAQNELGCHLLRSHKVSSMAENVNPDFLIFSKDNFRGFGGIYLLNNILRAKLSDPNYHIWVHYKGIIIISKKKFSPIVERSTKR